MKQLSNKYEVVIGLEVHAQLLTHSKLFCGDSTEFGAIPNTHVSPITLAHPGSLPKMNQKAIQLAIRLGLACNCEIVKKNYFARKNYFYPDLPKGYQISQHTTPICKGGFVKIKTAEGEKDVLLNRIHLEEDAGKSLHDAYPDKTAIDLNRAGTPLVEIVTEPNLRSSDEAFAYLVELRKMVRYLDVSDGNMEEGSMRCDANISVRLKGESKLGTKVEVKNLNSIRNVKRAIDYEASRLISLIEKGETIRQQTRSFDADNGTTFSIRDKEDAEDYRYFPDPDLPPFDLEDEFINNIRQAIPELAYQRILHYTKNYQLPEYDARVITEERPIADYFEQLVSHTTHYKAAANWMLGPLKSWMNESGKSISDFPIQPAQLGKLINMVADGKLSHTAASSKIFTQLLSKPDKDPLQIAEESNLLQQSDDSALEPLVKEVLDLLAEKVQEYKKGKKGLLALFVGQVMKKSKGKADPKKVNELLLKLLAE